MATGKCQSKISTLKTYKMNNLNVILAILFSTFFALTSCQKEGLEEMNNTVENTTEITETTNALVPNVTIDPNALALEAKTTKSTANEANSRNSNTIISVTDFTIERGEWKKVNFAIPENMPNADEYKIHVQLIPTLGNPDLFIYGWDAQANNPWREIRRSDRGASNQESTSFRKSDFKSNEERIYIFGYGKTNARYRVILRWYRVDCKEYPPAEPQFYSQIIQQVCTCDGTTFNHPGQAENAGYTDWSNGPCKLADGIYRNVRFAADQQFIKKIKISNNGRYIQVLSTACSNHWGGGDTCYWDKERLRDIGTRGYEAQFREGNLDARLQIRMEGTEMKVEVSLVYDNGGGARTQPETLVLQ